MYIALRDCRMPGTYDLSVGNSPDDGVGDRVGWVPGGGHDGGG